MQGAEQSSSRSCSCRKFGALSSPNGPYRPDAVPVSHGPVFWEQPVAGRTGRPVRCIAGNAESAGRQGRADLARRQTARAPDIGAGVDGVVVAVEVSVVEVADVTDAVGVTVEPDPGRRTGRSLAGAVGIDRAVNRLRRACRRRTCRWRCRSTADSRHRSCRRRRCRRRCRRCRCRRTRRQEFVPRTGSCRRHRRSRRRRRPPGPDRRSAGRYRRVVDAVTVDVGEVVLAEIGVAVTVAEDVFVVDGELPVRPGDREGVVRVVGGRRQDDVAAIQARLAGTAGRANGLSRFG